MDEERAKQLMAEIDQALDGVDPYATIELSQELNDYLSATGWLTWERLGRTDEKLVTEPELAYRRTHRVHIDPGLPPQGFVVVG